MAMVEYLDVFDFDNKSLQMIKERRRIHVDGDWHRTAQVWIINQNREVLCNLRSNAKDLFANYWDLSIGGHVVAGDSYEITALRELNEELGIKAELNDLVFLSDEKIDGGDNVTGLTDREHARLFLFKTEKNIEELIIQVEEIQEVKFLSIEKLIEVVTQEDPYFKVIPVKTYYTKILNLLKSR